MAWNGSDDLVALRERVRVLAAGLGVDEDFDVSPEVRRYAEAGETVKAIRELRRQTGRGVGLVAAKRMVDALGR
jgi:ribosomal protein L7/L12